MVQQQKILTQPTEMETMTKEILAYFRIDKAGIPLDLALEFKKVLTSKTLMEKETSSTENILAEITVEMDNGSENQWYYLSQGWGAGDDADNWIHLYDNLPVAKKAFKEFEV